jgi:hypothetical protein
VTTFDVSTIDSIEALWGAPNSGNLARRSVDSGRVKRQGPNTPRLLSCHGVMQIKDVRLALVSRIDADHIGRTVALE